MNRLSLVPALIAYLLTLAACGSTQERNNGTLPQPEAHLTTAREQAQYYLDHYWDKIDLEADSTLLEGEALNSLMQDYCGILTSFAPEESADALLAPIKRSSQQMLPHVLNLYQRYLYREPSLISSDDHYRIVLEWSISSPKVPQQIQERARLELGMINKNRIGERATDFIYTLADGKQKRLSYLNRPYNMLIFATPGCSSCALVLADIVQSQEMQQLVKQQSLHISVVYLMVHDPDEVRMHAEELPEWIEIGYDANEQILQQALYDFKTSPTMYLLDRQNKVLLKDTNSPACYHYITQRVAI